SRRRHTRFSRDWSSDVCSSDLPNDRPADRPDPAAAEHGENESENHSDRDPHQGGHHRFPQATSDWRSDLAGVVPVEAETGLGEYPAHPRAPYHLPPIRFSSQRKKSARTWEKMK